MQINKIIMTTIMATPNQLIKKPIITLIQRSFPTQQTFPRSPRFQSELTSEIVVNY